MRKLLSLCLAFGLALGLAAPASAALKNPDAAKTALLLMQQVANDFKRQITNKSFARVPHENEEYKEAAGALTAAVKDEPADFKAKVDTKLKAALAAAQHVADLSATVQDSDKLMAEHEKTVTAMNAVFDLFPADMRPDPNAAPPHRGPPPGAN